MNEFYQGAHKGKKYDASVLNSEKNRDYIENELPVKFAEINDKINQKPNRSEIPHKLNDLETNDEVVIFNCGDSEDSIKDVVDGNYNVRIKLKKDTEENWLKNDPILYYGEMAVSEKSNGEIEFRVGDGTNRFSDLKVVGGAAAGEYDDSEIRNLIADLQNNKVDKVKNKGLSSVDDVSIIGNGTVSDGVNVQLPEKTIRIKKNSGQIMELDVYPKEETDKLLAKKVDSSTSENGFAGGNGAVAGAGGAIGQSAVTGDGFAGGKNAQATKNDEPIDAIQLGTGTNPNEKTLQVYEYQLLDRNGKIPKARIPSDIGGGGSGGGEPADSEFTSYTLGSKYTGKNGLCQFSIKGINAKVTPDVPSAGYVRAYYYMSAKYKGIKPELPHTRAKVLNNGKEVFDMGDMFGISGTYTLKGVNYTYNDVYDEYTDNCFIQRISNEFFPKADYITEDLIQVNVEGKGTNNVLFELRIPEKAFGEQLPYKNTPDDYAPLVCPMSRTISENHLLNTVTAYNNYYGQWMSFAWHDGDETASTEIEKSGYYSLHFSSGTDGSTKKDLIKKLFSSKWFIRYTLAEPIYKYNTGKIYIHDGDIITIQNGDDNYPATCNYINTPSNISARVDGVESLTTDVLDLNKRVENVEVGDVSFGFPDGTTDNYDYIKSLLDNNVNTGVNKAIEIPAGKYYLSKPIFITNPHTTIRGNGNVIIICPTNQPSIVVQANYTTIENLTFYLSKTEDNAAAEADNGLHSAIYMDGGKGLYNNKILNCDFQGAYRFSTKNIERSYGIYYAPGVSSVYTPNEWGFSYFNIIDNCRFYGLYCGLYLSNVSQPVKAWFSFDSGDNIYNIPGTVPSETKPNYNAIGCGYGCICDGSSNFIRFDGQFIGENHMTPSDPVFETVDGVKKAVSATVNNVSVCAVKCSSKANYIEGIACDPQRTDKGYIWFTKTSKDNMFSLLYYGSLYGSSYGMVFEDTYKVYDSDNNQYELTMTRNHPYIEDESGLNKATLSTMRYQHDTFFNSNGYMAISEDGTPTYNLFPKHFGNQDNALAYVNKWGGHGNLPAIKCYRLVEGVETAVKVYDKDPSLQGAVETDISSVFTPYSEKGWTSGVTFDHIPTKQDPIYIDLAFDKPYKFERIFVRFNQYIAKDIDIRPITGFDPGKNLTGIAIQDNNQGQIDISTYHERWGYGNWETITGLRIVIKTPLSIGEYNTNKRVGISNIFALASNTGGKSYLPRGGGDMYGDLNLKDNKLFLGMVDVLPTPNVDNRGCTIMHKTDSGDMLYVCCKKGDKYVWESLDDKVDKIDGKTLTSNDYTDIDKLMSLRRNSMDWEKLNVLSRNFTIKGICYRATDNKYYALSPTQHGVYYYSDDGINFTPRISPYFYREYHKNGYLPAEMYCMNGGFIIISYKTDKTGWKLTYTSDIAYNSETTDTNDFIDIKTYTETFDKFSVYYDSTKQSVAVAVNNKVYSDIIGNNKTIGTITTYTFGSDATVWINSIRTIGSDTYVLTNKGVLYKNGIQLINYAENATIKEKIGTSTTYEFFDFNTITSNNVTHSFVVMTVSSNIAYNKYFCSLSIFYADGNLDSTTWITGVHNSDSCGMYTSHPICELLNNEPELFIFSNDEYYYTYKIGSTDWIYNNKKGGMSASTPKVQIISKSSAVKKVNGNWYFCDKFIDDMICIPSTITNPTLKQSETVKLKHDIASICNTTMPMGSYELFVDEEDATNFTEGYKKYINNGINIITAGGMLYEACLLGNDSSLTDDQYTGYTDKSYDILIDFEKGSLITTESIADKVFAKNANVLGGFVRPDPLTAKHMTAGIILYTSDYSYGWTMGTSAVKNVAKLPFKVNCKDKYSKAAIGYYGGQGGICYTLTGKISKTMTDSDNPNVKINDIYVFAGKNIGATKWVVGSNGYFGEVQANELVDQRICWWIDENYPITDDLYAVCCNDKYLVVGGDNGTLYILTDYNDCPIAKNISLDKSENIRYIIRDVVSKNVNKIQSSSEIFIIVTENGSIYTLDTGDDNPKAEFCSSIGNTVKRVEYMQLTGRVIIVDKDDNLYINNINEAFMPAERIAKYTPSYDDNGAIDYDLDGTFSEVGKYNGKAGLVPAPTANMVRCADVTEENTYDTTGADKEKYYRWMFFGTKSNNENWNSSYFLSADGKWVDLMPYKSAGKPTPRGISYKPFLCPASTFFYDEENNWYDMDPIWHPEKYFLGADGNWREVSTGAFTGATATADGTKGSVPAPAKGQQDLFLRADGTWSMAGLSDKMIGRVNAIVYYDGQYDDSATSPLELVASTQNVKCSDLTKTGTILIPFEINTTQITGIADNGFENSQCWYVYIPNTIITIGASVFKGCTNLMAIQLPDTITSIGESCFEGDTSLKKVCLSENMTSIPANAFKGCTALKSIFIPDTIDTIADTAFEGCLSTLKIYTVQGSAADTFATTKGFDCMYTIVKKS